MSRLLVLSLFAVAMAAQDRPISTVAPAGGGPAEVRALVDAGVLPRARLADAREMTADADDELLLGRILYGNLTVEELTEEQAREMLDAANRRFERQKRKLDHARMLVEEGVASRLSLTPLIEELDRRRRTMDLAVFRAKLIEDIADMARRELEEFLNEELAAAAAPPREQFHGNGLFRPEQLGDIVTAFTRQFARPLPVSAQGETATHRSMGYDHRGRVDVALDPDQPEGIWLRRYLEESGIPFRAFRGYLPGKSTAAHIHIGPPSGRIRPGG